MSSNGVKKPLLYWVTLVVMVIAFACIAVTSADEGRGATTDSDNAVTEVNAPQFRTTMAFDLGMCPQEILSSASGRS